MVKRIINWFKNYKLRNLIYNINGDHIEIIGLENKYVKSVTIPKEINGYPVQYIRQGILASWMLEYINGEKIKNRYHIINNRFIYKLGDSIIFNIKYQIGSDYYVCYHYYSHNEYSYLINDIEYVSNLRHEFRSITY